MNRPPAAGASLELRRPAATTCVQAGTCAPADGLHLVRAAARISAEACIPAEVCAQPIRRLLLLYNHR